MTTQKNNQGARVGNQNARKDETDKSLSMITARCHTSDKAQWVKAAQDEGVKLTDWIIDACNQKLQRRQATD
jgi:uncharacterized protein (DUF1778 family)